MKIVRYGDDGKVAKEWDIYVTPGGFFSDDHAICGIRTDIAPLEDDWIVDARGNKVRIVNIQPSDPGWFTIYYRTW